MAGLEPADSIAPCLTLRSLIDTWSGLESRPIRVQEGKLRIWSGLTVGSCHLSSMVVRGVAPRVLGVSGGGMINWACRNVTLAACEYVDPGESGWQGW